MASGAYEGPYSFQSRFEEGDGTNPEELIAAAHAGCFSMALSGELGNHGHEVESVETEARVHIDKVETASRSSESSCAHARQCPESTTTTSKSTPRRRRKAARYRRPWRPWSRSSWTRS